MKQATPKLSSKQFLLKPVAQRLYEVLMILAAALALFLVMSLTTFDHRDSAWSHIGPSGELNNQGGIAGAWFADVAFYFLGYVAYLIPLSIFASSIFYFIKSRAKTNEPINYQLLFLKAVGFILSILSSCALLATMPPKITVTLPLGMGGLIGQLVSHSLTYSLGYIGAILVAVACFFAGVTMATGLSWLELGKQTSLFIAKTFKLLLTNTQYYLLKANRYLLSKCQRLLHYFTNKRQQSRTITPKASEKTEKKTQVKQSVVEEIKSKLSPKEKRIPQPVAIKESKRAQAEKQLKLFSKNGPLTLPSFSLLESPKAKKNEISEDFLKHLSEIVESKLADFGVSAEVVAVYPGPVITRFELKLAPGVKVSKISSLAKDLARSMAVVSVRVVEVIPGKPVVGLELPNENREIVCFQEVIVSEEYEKMSSPLALALGKDIAGRPVVVDLAKMPHLLVAGTTGSGKSVGLNGMLLSILFKAKPEEVRLILIDPKMLELAVYDDIPHLLTPVVTDMKEAANSLRWCVAEMERRYQLMAALGVRNLSGFNRKVNEAIKQKAPILDPTVQDTIPEDERPTLEPMPFIVVVVDEFADMMMVVGKKVEELIARIAQKARAAGIHLILATQRPSVDVITGLIKANVPTRIAFQVATRIDSRTILDQQGAEQLLGRGDMLYLPIGAGVPTRVHGAFVEDHEVHTVVKDLKSRAEPQYVEEIVQGMHGKVQGVDKALLMQDAEDSDSEQDALYDQAVRIVTESRRASISLVQRKLKIGYNRAARLVEQMETEGVVSAMQSNGSREVLAPPPVEL